MQSSFVIYKGKINPFCFERLRSGGASSAAAVGISVRLFKKLGRWRSEKAKNGYVRETIQEK